jgi:hypothetical protein
MGFQDQDLLTAAFLYCKIVDQTTSGTVTKARMFPCSNLNLAQFQNPIRIWLCVYDLLPNERLFRLDYLWVNGKDSALAQILQLNHH